MKKAIVAILAVLYIVITSGVLMNEHYCMGRIASIDYGYHDHEVCGTCGMTESEQSSGCCHTEYKLVKMEDEHQQVIATIPSFETPVSIIAGDIVWIDPAPSKTSAHTLNVDDPPDRYSNSVYLRNCVFRI